MNAALKLLTFFLYSASMYGASAEVMSSYEIVKIDSIGQVIEKIKSYANEKSLYLVDLDDTAFMPVDPNLRNANSDAYHDFMNKLDQEPDALYLKTVLYEKAEWQLVDSVLSGLICDLKVKKATVYGCTARGMGPLLIGETSEEFTHRTAQSLNIHFDQHKIGLELFAYGILFCGKYTKGATVKRLLEESEKKIETIVMVDDRDYNLKSVAQAIEQWNTQKKQAIKFVGFHYTAVENMDHTFDKEIVAMQLEHLIKHKEYLSEEEIKSKMTNEQT